MFRGSDMNNKTNVFACRTALLAYHLKKGSKGNKKIYKKRCNMQKNKTAATVNIITQFLCSI